MVKRTAFYGVLGIKRHTPVIPEIVKTTIIKNAAMRILLFFITAFFLHRIILINGYPS